MKKNKKTYSVDIKLTDNSSSTVYEYLNYWIKNLEPIKKRRLKKLQEIFEIEPETKEEPDYKININIQPKVNIKNITYTFNLDTFKKIDDNNEGN